MLQVNNDVPLHIIERLPEKLTDLEQLIIALQLRDNYQLMSTNGD